MTFILPFFTCVQVEYCREDLQFLRLSFVVRVFWVYFKGHRTLISSATSPPPLPSSSSIFHVSRALSGPNLSTVCFSKNSFTADSGGAIAQDLRGSFKKRGDEICYWVCQLLRILFDIPLYARWINGFALQSGHTADRRKEKQEEDEEAEEQSDSVQLDPHSASLNRCWCSAWWMLDRPRVSCVSVSASWDEFCSRPAGG